MGRVDEVEVVKGPGLDDYSAVVHLSVAVQELRAEASTALGALEGRTVWMINSTVHGGGVAEMLPRMVSLLRALGVETRWLVIGTERQGFFSLTKRIHNLIHGSGEPHLNASDRELYETVSEEVADELTRWISPGDLLVVHDPQPAGAGALLKQRLEVTAIWRCHIGLDDSTKQTQAAWAFLEPYLKAYDHAVFTAPEYIPPYLGPRVSIIHPALDPFTHKNRELTTHKLIGILCNSGLLTEYSPVVTPPFDRQAERLQTDGSFAPATLPEDLGLIFRPLVTQVSRWDRLKGFLPLMEAFVRFKQEIPERCQSYGERAQRRMKLSRLVLAGPEPAAVQDDPEAQEVLEQLRRYYVKLPPEIQSEIALISLPMNSRKDNSLMVNALQRCSTVVVQNSLREGFGLTVTEAMWKRIAVLGTYACGIRQQIRHGIDGHLAHNPEDSESVADDLEWLLTRPEARRRYGESAQRRVHDEFLVFVQLRKWLSVLRDCVAPPPLSRPPELEG